MLLRQAATIRVIRSTLVLLGVVSALGCGGGGSSDDLCSEVCDRIQQQCEPDGFDVRTDCEEACRAELRSRTFVQGEDVCLECCVDVVLPPNKCTDVFTDCQDSGVNNAATNDKCVIGDHPDDNPDDPCARRFGFSICLDDSTVCAGACEDNIGDVPIEECGP